MAESGSERKMRFPFVASLDGKKYVGRLARYSESMGEGARRASLCNESAGVICYLPTVLGTRDIVASFVSEGGDYIGEARGEWRSRACEHERYYIEFPGDMRKKAGLYYFGISGSGFRGAFHLVKGEGADDVAILSGEHSERHPFQTLVCDFENPPPPKALTRGIVYHVFVDRFRSTGKYIGERDDAVILDWEHDHPECPSHNGGHIENNTFFGGDLDGIIEKLDYISSLGTTCLYLSPVFEAYSNHKYDTGDYMRVDRMFGGDDALARLIVAAKKRGISVVLDGVFNHTGSDSIYFNKRGRYCDGDPGAYNSQISSYAKWYNFFHFPDSYECWWGIDTLPRLMLGYPPCSDYFVGRDGVIARYMDMGIVGFRLDVADELPDEFIRSLKRASCRGRRRSVVWGEVWEDASNKTAYGKRKTYFCGGELDGVMNYPLRRGLIDFFTRAGCSALRYAIETVGLNCPKRISDYQLNFLGTHDTERILTLLAGEDSSRYSAAEKTVFKLSADARALAVSRLRAAYLTLVMMPGIPSVFYGDEAGVEGFGDPWCRAPFPWGREDGELVRYYSEVGRLRRTERVLFGGEGRALRLDDGTLVYLREDENEALVLAVNILSSPLEVEAKGTVVLILPVTFSPSTSTVRRTIISSCKPILLV